MYGFVVTSLGMSYLLKLVAGTEMQISDVVVGSGRVPDGTDLALMTDLATPERRATSTMPVVEDNVCSFIVEYRTDLAQAADGTPLPNGNPTGFWLNEFGVFVIDPDLGRIMLYYGTLGDYPQFCMPYTGGAVDIRRYPVSIGLSADVTVVLNYPAIAWMTAEDVHMYVASVINDHINKTIFSIDGVHGMRYYDDALQGWDGSHWIDIGGSPIIKSVYVGLQVETITEGEAATVTFPVATTGIPNGNYNAAVASLPTGVTVQGQVAITGNVGTLTLAGDTTTIAGAYTNLVLTINSISSSAFTLIISEPYDPNAQSGYLGSSYLAAAFLGQ